jgi:hypothetical protein
LRHSVSGAAICAFAGKPASTKLTAVEDSMVRRVMNAIIA